MKRASIYGTAIVVCHAIVSLVHGVAHSELHIDLSRTETCFVLMVIGLCPLVPWDCSGLAGERQGLSCWYRRWRVLSCSASTITF